MSKAAINRALELLEAANANSQNLETTIASLASAFAAARNEIRFLDTGNAALQDIHNTAPTVDKMAFIHCLARGIAPHLPGYKTQALGPFGIAAETAIHVYSEKTDEIVASLNFRSKVPSALFALTLVDYGRSTQDYPAGSLGAFNGLNHPTVPIPETIGELVDMLKQQIVEADGSCS